MSVATRTGPLAARAAAVLAGAALAAAACGGEGANGASAFTVRDSAGVRISESAAPAWGDGEAWTVADTPEVSIGVVEGDSAYQLYQVRGATRLSDGTIVVADGGANDLRFYDASGRFLRSAGGEGGAPGEFRTLWGAARIPGDTLVAFDFRGQRLSLFGPDGSFARDIALAGAQEGGFLMFAGALDGGRIVALRRGGPGTMGAEGLSRDTADYLVLDGSARQTADLGRFPGSERFVKIGRQDGKITSIQVTTVPFGHDAYAAVGSVGDSGRIWIGSNDRWEIREFAPDGTLLRILRRTDVTPSPVTDAMKDRAVEARLAARRERQPNAAASDLADARRTLEDSPAPETRPVFGPVLADPEGNLWVSEYRPSWAEDGPTVWTVLDPDGRWLGTVTTPPGLQLYEVGRDYVLGRRTDDLGVEHVEMYGLERGGG